MFFPLFTVFLAVRFANCLVDLCGNVTSLCVEQQSCRDCLRVHHCCNWCYEPNYPNFRCFPKSSQSSCPDSSKILNEESSAVPIINKIFTNLPDSATNPEEFSSDVVQLKPQLINLKLRKNEPINFTIQFKAAKNYPLDLYYLMDLTNSMEKDLNTIRKLGFELAQALGNLTKNYKLAFGSYVDKTEMPFYLTDPDNVKNPCTLMKQSCDSGYLFKHRLNFTKNINSFIREVEKSKLSANVDNLEGGLDALMQILLCENQLEWSENSRKIVIIATESAMHTAGDGILVGAIRRNFHKCLIDSKGNYLESLIYDYPSLAEVHKQLERRKINAIFAVKENSGKYYTELHSLIPESTFIGKLKEDSTNILELVKIGYYKFIKRVSLTINKTQANDLEINYFANCNDVGGEYNKSNTCNNVEEGKIVNFKIQITLKEYSNKLQDTLYIEERNIRERVELKIDYSDNKCLTCALPDIKKNCGNGNLICGNCSCFDGWTGVNCLEPCDVTIQSCRQVKNDTVSITCYGNGDCICGKCVCNEPYNGKYCEYQCPVDKQSKLVCGGANRGACVEGACICESTYSGPDCSCSLSREKCVVPGKSTICNSRGSCKCNKCVCDAGFKGEFCQICSNCEGLCDVYLNCVSEMIHNKSSTCLVGKDVINSKFAEIFDFEIEKICKYIYLQDEQTCEVDYSYVIKKGGYVDVNLKKPNCYNPIKTSSVISFILLAIIGIGILIIAAIKLLNMYRDRMEYKRFEEETLKRNFQRQENPLYKSPIVTYNNPIEMTTFHGKSD